MPAAALPGPHPVSAGGGRRRWWSALLLAVALMATGCTGNSADSATNSPTPTTADTTADGTAPSLSPPTSGADQPDAELVAGPNVQDMWLFTDVRMVDDRGRQTSVLDDIVAELLPAAGDPVDLAGLASVAPVPDMQVQVVANDGTVRDHIQATVVLWEAVAPEDRPTASSELMAEGHALGIVTTAPPDTVNVSVGDNVQLHPDQLAATTGAETLAVDYVFGQALPNDEDGSAPPDKDDDLAMLAARWDAGSIRWMGHDGQPMVRVGVVGSRRLPAGEMPSRQTTEPAGDTAEPAASVDRGGQPPADPVGAQPASFDVGQNHVGPTATTVKDPGTILGPPLGLPIKEGMIGWGSVVFAVLCITGAVIITGGAGVVFAVVCVSVDAVATVGSVLDGILDNDSPPGCQPGQTCGSSGNDPHLTTFDNVAFDAHAQGEVVLVRGPDLEVQARMAPVNESTWAANNSAVALNVAGDVVVLDRLADTPFPRHAIINGEPRALADADQIELSGGGHVQRAGSGIIVTWLDGTSVTTQLTRGHVNVFVHVPDERSGEVVGLLGDADGEPEGEPFTSDGTTFEDPSAENLTTIVDSWRVTEAESLFPDELTHDQSFPSQAPSIDGLPDDRVALAQSVCEGRGLADVDLANCLIDVAVTGDPVMANGAAEQQGLHRPDAFVAPERYPLVGPSPDRDALEAARSTCLDGGVYRDGELEECTQTVARTDDSAMVAFFEASQFVPTASLDDACLAALGIPDSGSLNELPDSLARTVAEGPTPSGTIAWRMSEETDSEVDDFGPAAGNDDVVVAAGAALQAHDPTNGALMWNVAATGAKREPVLAADVVITTGETGHTLHLASTGEPCGTVQISPEGPGEKLNLAAPMVTDGWLVTKARFGVQAVVGIDLATGASWVHPEQVTYLSADAADGIVAIGAGGDARSLDLSTGQPRWSEHLKFIVDPVVIAAGLVLANDINLTLQARDPASGALVWEADHDGSSWDDKIAATDEIVVTAGSSDGLVVGADVTTGAQRWVVELPDRPRQPVVVGDSVWLAVNEVVVGLSLQDGSEVATLDLDADSIVAIPGGLAVATDDGDVVIVR